MARSAMPPAPDTCVPAFAKRVPIRISPFSPVRLLDKSCPSPTDTPDTGDTPRASGEGHETGPCHPGCPVTFLDRLSEPVDESARRNQPPDRCIERADHVPQ